MNKLLITGILVCANAVVTAFANPDYSYQHDIMVPSGTILRTTMTTPLNSEHAILGQTVTTAICEDFYYNNQLIAPAGSIVYGTVTEPSKITIRFNNIKTPYGTQIPISGVIHTEENNIEIPSNAIIDLVLTQPATISSASYNY